jgi:hypothetical protein
MRPSTPENQHETATHFWVGTRTAAVVRGMTSNNHGVKRKGGT